MSTNQSIKNPNVSTLGAVKRLAPVQEIVEPWLTGPLFCGRGKKIHSSIKDRLLRLKCWNLAAPLYPPH